MKIFVLMVLKAQVRTCELHSHERKQKDDSNPLIIEVKGVDLWRQFQKIRNFCFYGRKGTGPGL